MKYMVIGLAIAFALLLALWIMRVAWGVNTTIGATQWLDYTCIGVLSFGFTIFVIGIITTIRE